MKKVFSFIIILVMLLSASAFADLPDISGLSFDELVALKEQINLAIWNSQEWQEVEVPIGTYLIGQDIPAGKWTISCNENYYLYLEVGNGLLENGTIDVLANIDSYTNCFLYGPKYILYNEGNATFITIDLKDGQYIHIDNGSAYFSPFTGNSFKFK